MVSYICSWLCRIELNMQVPLEELSPRDARRAQQLREDIGVFCTGFANGDSRWFIPTILFPELGELVVKAGSLHLDSYFLPLA